MNLPKYDGQLHNGYDKRGECGFYLNNTDYVDGIVANEIVEKYIPQPKGISESFECTHQPLQSKAFIKWITDSGKKPETSSIYIVHDEGDTLEMDLFGAKIVTRSLKQNDDTVYYRHFIYGVSSDSPADKMKIRKGDELVILDGHFAPHLQHADLLRLFNHVKVDGRTRFKLITRRIEKVKGQPEERWMWVETSAILTPSIDPEKDETPNIENPKIYKHDGNVVSEGQCLMMYKIDGTQRFLEIKNNDVTANVIFNTESDRYKRICKWTRIQFESSNSGILHYLVALSNEEKTCYISINDDRTIELKNTPSWFEYRRERENFWFMKSGAFLSYNKDTLRLEASPKKFLFHQYPADLSGLDNVDAFATVFEEDDGDYSDEIYDLCIDIHRDHPNFGLKGRLRPA